MQLHGLLDYLSLWTLFVATLVVALLSLALAIILAFSAVIFIDRGP
jgi:ABC-type phosphate transport system permease subunit